MPVTRLLASLLSVAAVIGCAALVMDMGEARGAAATGRLPLRYKTGSAKQVITVTAKSYDSTVGTWQAWRKSKHRGWVKVGRAATAHLGTEGITTSPAEWKSAAPAGAFRLARAFGYKADPGTRLPYKRMTPAHWWISEPGPLYNTLQKCADDCSFTQGAPNEHMFYIRPQYAYGMVIEYNTNHVKQGAGSAFFVHVTDGGPTGGCVALARKRLVAAMKWLRPSRHPRILIGVP